MADTTQAPAGALGFLTVLSSDRLGLIGGYLVVNYSGRPLEFHCTAPIKPSRAQQILYGATLAPYLYGEQIGRALVQKSSAAPSLICADVVGALAVRQFITQPVVLVLAGETPPEQSSGEGATWRVDAAHRAPADLAEFHWNDQRLAATRSRSTDAEQALALLADVGQFDLVEPFGRIREAIEEAQRGAFKSDA